MIDKSAYEAEYRRIGAKKSLGQNFLTSDAVVENMINHAEITRADTILEIGPGLGILSRALVASPADTIIMCEKDEKLAEILKREITNKRAKIVTDDALILIPQLQVSAPFKVVSNLPYNISSPVITSLLTMSPTLPERIIVMLQKEVAERFITPPGNRNRGILTVLVELYGKAQIIDQVSRENFYPSPNVDSAVLMIDNINAPEIDAKKLMKILKMSFAGKRKKLKNSIISTLQITPKELAEISKQTKIDFNDRPEDLVIDQWIGLYRVLQKIRPI